MYNVNPLAEDQDGGSPLHAAISGNQKEIVELLVEKYHADPNSAASISDIHPLHICAQYGFVHLLEWLCEKYKADPNVSKFSGYQPIHIAAHYGHLAVIHKLKVLC